MRLWDISNRTRFKASGPAILIILFGHHLLGGTRGQAQAGGKDKEKLTHR